MIRTSWWRGACFFVTLTLVSVCGAFAHPLGNFTINHLARVTWSPGTLHVRYVLDIAEIPTFQIMQDRTQGQPWTPSIARTWANDESAVVLAGLHITDGANPLSLKLLRVQSRLRPGAGGLPILYWVGDYEAPLTTAASHSIAIRDDVYSDRRIGWKDITIGAQTEPTHELQIYPSALIGTPRRIGVASFTLSSNGAIEKVSETQDDSPQIASSAYWWIAPTALSDMFTRPNRTPWFILLTVLAAFGLGALHAIEPGHGKALLAVTLVGARATGKQAVILALSLTFAHTIGVIILGFVLFFAAGFVSEEIYPWITLLSGVAIAVIGARALAKYVAARRESTHVHEHTHGNARPHAHDHEHDHAHDDGSAQGHGHSHAIPGAAPLNFSNAVWAAMSGGIAPCPAAIVVLLAALRLHQLGYGMILIVIFSMGLAAVLTSLGIAVVHGSGWLSRRSSFSHIVQYGPLASAMVISTIGAWMLAQGFNQQGIVASPILIALVALLAIAGYSFSRHGHSHGLAHSHSEAAST